MLDIGYLSVLTIVNKLNNLSTVTGQLVLRSEHSKYPCYNFVLFFWKLISNVAAQSARMFMGKVYFHNKELISFTQSTHS